MLEQNSVALLQAMEIDVWETRAHREEPSVAVYSSTPLTAAQNALLSDIVQAWGYQALPLAFCSEQALRQFAGPRLHLSSEQWSVESLQLRFNLALLSSNAQAKRRLWQQLCQL